MAVQPPAVAVPRSSVARNAAALASGTLAARLLMFGLGIVMARALGPESYGRYSFALALGLILQPVADFGLTPYVAREVARAREAGEAALPRLLAAKGVLLVAVLATSVALTLPLGADGELVAVVAVMVLATLLDGVSMFAYGYFQGREAMTFEARQTARAAVVRAAGGIVLVLATGRLWPVVAWVLIVAAVQAWTAFRRLGAVVGRARLRPSLSGAAVRWRSVVAMGLVTCFVMVYLRADTVLVGWLESERAVGLYAAAYTLMLGAQVPAWMLSTALMPVFARTYAADRPAFLDTWHAGVRALVLVALPIALTISILSGPLVERFFGDAYASSARVLAVVIWICPLVALSLLATGVLRAAGREGELTAVAGTCALLNVSANLWAISRHGIMGAAVVTVATEALNALALGTVCLRSRLVPVPRFPLVRAAIACAALALVAVLASSLLVEAAVLAAVAAYLAVLAATGVAGGKDVRALRAALARRP